MLQRKREALLVLAKDLEKCMRERDQLKQVATKYLETCECSAAVPLEKQLNLINTPGDESERRENDRVSEIRRQKAAVRELMLKKSSLESQVKDLKQKLSEAHEDIKLLRETVARQRLGGGDLSTSDFPKPESNTESLLTDLEQERLKSSQLEQELNTYRDEMKEIADEKDFYISRCERLNTELNYLLSGDSDHGIFDIDAMALENRHLKQQVAQLNSEKAQIKEHYQKLKSSIGAKKQEGSALKKVLPSGKTKQTFMSPKQVQEFLIGSAAAGGLPVNAHSVEDLHKLAISLSETVNEKNVALMHQKKTNQALGNRVSELEKKLKTFETTGLWNTRERETRLDHIRAEILESSKDFPPDLVTSVSKTPPRQISFEEAQASLMGFSDESTGNLSHNSGSDTFELHEPEIPEEESSCNSESEPPADFTQIPLEDTASVTG